MTARSGRPDSYRRAVDEGKLRGDYGLAGADFIVEQNWSAYSAEEHALFSRLYRRQSRQVPKYACAQFLDSLARLDAGGAIPRFDLISTRLMRATRWELVAVPGLVPDEVFFRHLANRRFPVTVWLRTPAEADYIVEPDVFHDFFGHVPLLFDPAYADYLQEYGMGGLKALDQDALGFLARLYWYSIEFGLILCAQGLKAYGAGLLSSSGELAYSVNSPRPRRILFDLARIMRTEYRIDRYQDSYFVIDGFEQLLRETGPDFTPIYASLKALPALAPDAGVPGDVLL